VHADYLIDFSPTVSTAQSAFGYNGDGRIFMASSFTTTAAGTIQTGKSYARDNSGSVGTYRVYIMSDSGSNTPSGTVLGTDTSVAYVSNSDCTSANAEADFDFGTPISVDALTKYWIVYSVSDAGSGSNFISGCKGEDPGQLYKSASEGSGYSSYDTEGFAFKATVLTTAGGGDEATSTVSVAEAGDIIYMLGWIVFFQALMAMGFFFRTAQTK